MSYKRICFILSLIFAKHLVNSHKIIEPFLHTIVTPQIDSPSSILMTGLWNCGFDS